MRIMLLIALLLAAPVASGAELRELARIALSGPENFGGFSGWEVDGDGLGFVAISDRGWFATGALVRNIGTLTGTRLDRLEPLEDSRENGGVTGFRADAEGLAINAAGALFVSFEGHHRVWRYDTIGGPPEWLHKWDYFWHLQGNSGMEALAIDSDGTLYAIPERSGKWTRPFPVYRYRGGKWIDPLSIPRSKKFLPTGADFGPDGKLYLLERDFTWIGGFSSRIRRFILGPDGFDEGEILLRTGPGAYDNMEGLAAWRDGDGAIRLLTISDDNFNPLQSTEIVEFRVVE